MARPKNILKNKPPQSGGIQTFTCITCGENKKITDFYKSYNSAYKATGKVPICKDCVKRLSYNSNGTFNIDKFKNALKSIDRPFIYNIFEASFEEDGDTIGKYIKNISMPQYKDLEWKDSEFETKNSEMEETEEPEQAIYSEDWRGKYTASDLKYLEDYLKALRKDFKITTRNHIDYARKIAKASLAMDRAYDDMLNGNGSESKYKNLREAFDTLSKSAQFAEVGRGINDVSLGNFGVIFDRVEKHQWVPKHVPENKDIYDNLLEQFSNINKSL